MPAQWPGPELGPSRLIVNKMDLLPAWDLGLAEEARVRADHASVYGAATP